jgi:hypothetical protein
MKLPVAEMSALLMSFFGLGIAAGEPTTTLQMVAQPRQELQGAPLRFASRSGIDRVQFVMDLPFTEHPAAANAESLARTGCNYESQEPPHTFAMEWLLRNAQIKADVGTEKRELRQLLSIHLLNGSTLEFDFGEVFPSDDVVRGHLNGMPITARRQLQADLFQWAGSVAVQADRCGLFLENYKYARRSGADIIDTGALERSGHARPHR